MRPDAAYVFDADEPRNRSDVVADESPWTAAAVHPSGRELLVGDARGHAGLLSLARNAMSPLPRPLHPAAVTAAAFHPDGRRCLTADREGRVLLSRVDREAATDADRPPLEPSGGLRLEEGDWATRAVFSAPGDRAFLGTARGWLLVLELAAE